MGAQGGMQVQVRERRFWRQLHLNNNWWARLFTQCLHQSSPVFGSLISGRTQTQTVPTEAGENFCIHFDTYQRPALICLQPTYGYAIATECFERLACDGSRQDGQVLVLTSQSSSVSVTTGIPKIHRHWSAVAERHNLRCILMS